MYMRNSRTLKSKKSYRSRSNSRSRSRSNSRSNSRSKSRSKSRSSFSSSFESPPVLKREYQRINITKKQASEVIKHRVEQSRVIPPQNWEKWNENNSKLFEKNASIPYPEYNKIFVKKDDFPF